MTYKEAKKIIVNSYVRFGRCNGKTIFFEALRKAAEAIDKQIPIKTSKCFTAHYCTKCGNFVSEKYPYCHWCGQALDWSDTL